jgi:hypothetical protein
MAYKKIEQSYSFADIAINNSVLNKEARRFIP